jgi:hypothetical protein
MSKVSKSPFFQEARKGFHAALLKGKLLTINANGVPSIADVGSRLSIEISRGIIGRLGGEVAGDRLSGQMAGAKFEDVVGEFLRLTFPKLQNVRPGNFEVKKGSSRLAIAECDQYDHLAALKTATENDPALAVALGADYIIKPDIMIFRHPEDDDKINHSEFLVNSFVAKRTSIRSSNSQKPILHASVSCKWTLRSDRAQNARSEALNLIRNRKGRLPHIAIVTGEPTPNRLASLALGTGDIDCVYHFALDELVQTIEEQDREDSIALLKMMIDGKRLRDIADLPLDLAV